MPNSQKHTVLRKMIDGSRGASESHHQMAQSIKAKMDAKRTPAEKAADWFTSRFGSMVFLIVNLIWFMIWITLNVGIIPGIEPFDPFPFGLLTMIVSLEAIMLAIIVLISQNREAQVAALREEIDVYINIRTERELTKLLEMVTLLLEKHGITTSTDATLQAMLQERDSEEIVDELEEELKKG